MQEFEIEQRFKSWFNPGKNAEPHQKKLKEREYEFLNYDFWDGCIRSLENNGIYYKSKRLISISAITKAVKQIDLEFIDAETLEKAKTIGTNLMENLKFACDSEIQEIDDMSFANPTDRIVFGDFINFFTKHKFKIMEVEKFWRNKSYCGFIDMIVKKNTRLYGVEIKTRSNLQIRASDIIQANFYKQCTGMDMLLIIYDRNKREFRVERVNTHIRKYKLNEKFKKYMVGLKKYNWALNLFGYPPLDKVSLDKPIYETVELELDEKDLEEL